MERAPPSRAIGRSLHSCAKTASGLCPRLDRGTSVKSTTHRCIVLFRSRTLHIPKMPQRETFVPQTPQTLPTPGRLQGLPQHPGDKLPRCSGRFNCQCSLDCTAEVIASVLGAHRCVYPDALVTTGSAAGPGRIRLPVPSPEASGRVADEHYLWSGLSQIPRFTNHAYVMNEKNGDLCSLEECTDSPFFCGILGTPLRESATLSLSSPTCLLL